MKVSVVGATQDINYNFSLCIVSVAYAFQHFKPHLMKENVQQGLAAGFKSCNFERYQFIHNPETLSQCRGGGNVLDSAP